MLSLLCLLLPLAAAAGKIHIEPPDAPQIDLFSPSARTVVYRCRADDADMAHLFDLADRNLVDIWAQLPAADCDYAGASAFQRLFTQQCAPSRHVDVRVLRGKAAPLPDCAVSIMDVEQTVRIEALQQSIFRKRGIVYIYIYIQLCILTYSSTFPSPDEPMASWSIASGMESFFEIYRRFDEIVTFFRAIAAENPARCTFIESIGKTHEGRDIPVLVITNRSSTRAKNTYW